MKEQIYNDVCFAVDSIDVDAKHAVFIEENSLGVYVGSTSGRTILVLTDEGKTDLRIKVIDDCSKVATEVHAHDVMLTLSGDSERDTLISALEYAVKTLKEQRGDEEPTLKERIKTCLCKLYGLILRKSL